MHLDNVTGKSKDNISKDQSSSFTDITEGYCNICNNRHNNQMNTMNQMNIRKMLIRKNLLMGSGEIKLMS